MTNNEKKQELIIMDNTASLIKGILENMSKIELALSNELRNGFSPTYLERRLRYYEKLLREITKTETLS